MEFENWLKDLISFGGQLQCQEKLMSGKMFKKKKNETKNINSDRINRIIPNF